MSEVKFTTTLYFNVPDGVLPSDHIDHLAELVHLQPELLLLQIVYINTEGNWGVCNA